MKDHKYIYITNNFTYFMKKKKIIKKRKEVKKKFSLTPEEREGLSLCIISHNALRPDEKLMFLKLLN